jgi:hypothetical protein
MIAHTATGDKCVATNRASRGSSCALLCMTTVRSSISAPARTSTDNEWSSLRKSREWYDRCIRVSLQEAASRLRDSQGDVEVESY